MMNPVPRWTMRAKTRLRDAFLYIATNFYPGYAVAFENDVFATTETIPQNPEIGVEAFCSMKRPQYRKILCKNRNWWVYYRIRKDCIEVLSVKHILQQVRTFRDL